MDTEALEKGHRYFAVVNNNQAWDLATSTRNEEEDLEMLTCAHTAAFHWGAVGTELHQMRATTLLAEVHAQLNLGSIAKRYADTIFDFYSNRKTDDWEIALVHAVYANAARANQEPDLFKTHYQLAKEAIEAIEEEKEREIILQTFNLLPSPV